MILKYKYKSTLNSNGYLQILCNGKIKKSGKLNPRKTRFPFILDKKVSNSGLVFLYSFNLFVLKRFVEQ